MRLERLTLFDDKSSKKDSSPFLFYIIYPLTNSKMGEYPNVNKGGIFLVDYNNNNNHPINPQQNQGGQQPDDIKILCRKYMNYHVIGQLSDGSKVDGIIDDMDEESVTMLVPEEFDGEQENRQYGYGDEYDDYGRPRRRRYRRFRRLRFPYVVFVFPYIRPYPYYYPYGYIGYY